MEARHLQALLEQREREIHDLEIAQSQQAAVWEKEKHDLIMLLQEIEDKINLEDLSKLQSKNKRNKGNTPSYYVLMRSKK